MVHLGASSVESTSMRNQSKNSLASKPASASLVGIGGHKYSGYRTEKKELADNKREEHILISPGYHMTRTKDQIAVTLGEEFFEPISQPKEDKQKPLRKVVQCEIDGIIEDYQEQIAQLIALLEQEKRDHRRTKEMKTKELNDTIAALEQNNEIQIRTLKKTHASELNALRQQYNATQEEQKTEAQLKYVDLCHEFEFLKNSFRTYKESLTDEMQDQQLVWEADWKKVCKQEKENALLQQKQTLLKNFEKEHYEALKKAQNEMFVMQENHILEKQALWQQYANAIQEAIQKGQNEVNDIPQEELKVKRKRKKDLKKTDVITEKMLQMEHLLRQKSEMRFQKPKPETLKSLEVELSEKKENLLNSNQALQQSRQEVERMNKHALETKEAYQQKINGMNEKCDHSVHFSMKENTDLGRKLISKSDELLHKKMKEKTGLSQAPTRWRPNSS